MPPLAVGLLAVLPAAVLIYILRRRRDAAQRLEELRLGWGKEQQRPRDFELLQDAYRICPPLWGDPSDRIDAQTCSDLNLNEVYARIDRTLTTAGECLLYQAIRSPLLTGSVRAKRRELIRLFQENAATRDALRIVLLSLGKSNERGLISLVWTEVPVNPNAWVFSLLAAAAILLPVAAFLAATTPLAIGSIILMFTINMGVHYKLKSQLLGRLSALRQLHTMIVAGERVSRIQHTAFAEQAEILRNAARVARPISRKASMLLPDGSSVDLLTTLLEYVSIYFLHDIRTFHALQYEIAKKQKEVQALFCAIGELDAWQSVAGFRAGNSGRYCDPMIADEGPALGIEDALHPLIADPVPNSILMESKGIAVTGSNMSGKTTFLKTVAVNAILAQTIDTCLAKRYQSRPIRIMASINETDDLQEGKSYYLAEAERLLKIIREAESSKLVLAVIDEPLAGTNSPQRFAASREILRYLAKHNALVMVSTHDVELVTELQRQGDLEPYHFVDTADDQGIRFDYRIRSGLDYQGNAIRVLKYLGYPDAIVDGALESMPSSK